MSEKDLLHADVTDAILTGLYHVYNTLGYGFLEKVYENSLALTLRKRGFAVRPQLPIAVYFEGVQVGKYAADLFVNSCVIVEIKSAIGIDPAHEAQLINYLRATDIEVGLLLNFGEKPEFRRKVHSNKYKSHRKGS
jgi:GxxExxY protein